MAGEGVEQVEKARFVGRCQKTNEALRFIIKYVDSVRRWIGEGEQHGQGNQFLRRDRFRMRFADVTTSALITGVRISRDIFGEAFVQPARNTAGIKAMHHKMRNFMAEKVAAKFVC